MDGSRVVGGYQLGVHGEEYYVVGIDRGPRPTWSSWLITVRWLGDRRVTTHCTGWDDRRDAVVEQPPA
ncbi:hypothetical protein ABZZ17_19815 [Streptomyces sp. NPDC006512]|uniref:hypothetical protein n=1 Tax=Streptomyces sp. NPDC006512 TaxID=3154307 RepID=UPI0033A2EC16